MVEWSAYGSQEATLQQNVRSIQITEVSDGESIVSSCNSRTKVEPAVVKKGGRKRSSLMVDMRLGGEYYMRIGVCIRLSCIEIDA